MSKLAQAGRQQHRIALFGKARRLLHRIVHIHGTRDPDTASVQCRRDDRRIPPDQHHRARVLHDNRFERGKILPFALTAGNQYRLASQALQRGNGRANIGALRIVVIGDAADLVHAFHAVGQPLEAAQCFDQCLHRQTDGTA